MCKKELEQVKRALIHIDAVEGFTRIGAFANPYMEALIPEWVRLTKEFLEAGDLVIASRENHTDNSVEFKTFPPHCIRGTEESQLVSELRPFEDKIKMFYKNSTCLGVLREYLNYLEKLKNLEEVVFTGGVTPICLIQAAIPTKCFFNEIDRDVRVIVPKNAVDTYDAPNHNRDEWNEMSFRFMEQSGIEIVKKYERGK